MAGVYKRLLAVTHETPIANLERERFLSAESTVPLGIDWLVCEVFSSDAGAIGLPCFNFSSPLARGKKKDAAPGGDSHSISCGQYERESASQRHKNRSRKSLSSNFAQDRQKNQKR
jgi:hypothetical protein